MKSIRESDLVELNDVIVELPAFRNLSNKDMIHEVLNLFTRDLYLDRPKELFDAFDSKLSKKMQTTFFENHGIDSDYSDKLTGYVKSDIAYLLEKLFQEKGSNQIFKLLATVLESIFPRINFYNVEVHKKEAKTESGYLFEYKLFPIYIQDESHVLKEPGVDIKKSRKYMMELKNFEEYTIWPVPTDLIYIQFSVGTDLINNLDTFLNGVRAYSTTYLSGLYFNYLSDAGSIEKLEASDMELLVAFFGINVLAALNPGWSPMQPNTDGTHLPIFRSGAFTKLDTETDAEYQQRILSQNEQKCNFMTETAILFRDYSEANYANRKDMESLRRRWQMYLRVAETTNVCFNSLEEMNSLVKEKYPRLYEDFFKDVGISYEGAPTDMSSDPDEEGIFSFYLKIYSIFLNGASSSFEQEENENCFRDYSQPRPIVSYTWREESGSILSTDKELKYTPDRVGRTDLTLTVENETGFVDSDTVTILVTEDGEATPSVSIERDRIIQVKNSVTVRGMAEAMQNESIVSYEFRLNGELIKDSIAEIPIFIPTRIKKVSVTFLITEVKDYRLELKVVDSTGHANYNTMVVRSIKGETPVEVYPQANSGPNLRGILNQELVITGSGKDQIQEQLHDTDWILTYIDVVFGSLFLNRTFMDDFFHPIMDLFERYFLPVELDYVSDLTNREKIRDKWNSISTEEIINPMVLINKTSIQTPIRGLDQANVKLFLGPRRSYINKREVIQVFNWNPNAITPDQKITVCNPPKRLVY